LFSFFHSSSALLVLHSFPTRRSSDLVKLGVGAMPGPNNPEGGVLVGGAANFIVNKSSPAEQAAAFEFAKYLAEPQVQSDWAAATDRKSTRLNSSHQIISYAVFCLKKK